MTGPEFWEWFERFFILSFVAVLVVINKDLVRERTRIKQNSILKCRRYPTTIFSHYQTVLMTSLLQERGQTEKMRRVYPRTAGTRSVILCDILLE